MPLMRGVESIIQPLFSYLSVALRQLSYLRRATYHLDNHRFKRYIKLSYWGRLSGMKCRGGKRSSVDGINPNF